MERANTTPSVAHPEGALSSPERDQLGLDAALRFLSHRPRSEWELRRRLNEKGHEPDRIDRVVERLRELKLLDDREFAAFWLENRQLHRPRGERALRAELYQKGLHRDVVDQAIEADDRDDGDDAYRAAQRRAATLSTVDESAFRQRLGQFLKRRGFDWDAIGPTVDRLWQERTG